MARLSWADLNGKSLTDGMVEIGSIDASLTLAVAELRHGHVARAMSWRV